MLVTTEISKIDISCDFVDWPWTPVGEKNVWLLEKEGENYGHVYGIFRKLAIYRHQLAWQSVGGVTQTLVL